MKNDPLESAFLNSIPPAYDPLESALPWAIPAHHPNYYPMEGPLHDPEITIRQLSDVLISVNGDRNDQTFISYYSSATADVRRQFDEYYKVYFKLNKKR